MQRREFIALVGRAAAAATDRGEGRSGWPESGWPDHQAGSGTKNHQWS